MESLNHSSGITESARHSYDIIKNIFESFTFLQQFFVAIATYAISHLHIATGIVAFFVLLFNLKIVYFRSKKEELEYKKSKQKP